MAGKEDKGMVSKEVFIELVRKQFGADVSTKDAELIVSGFVKALTEALKQGKVKIYRFGSFDRGIKPARNGRNPHTGEAIKIPARIFAKFKPSPNLKDILAEELMSGSKSTKKVAAKPVAKKAAPAKKPAPKAAAKPVAKAAAKKKVR
jgi:DNA-binding protein HU-beta